jgi:hypothetical protein
MTGTTIWVADEEVVRPGEAVGTEPHIPADESGGKHVRRVTLAVPPV